MKRISKSILSLSSTYLVLTIGLLLIFTSCNNDDDSGEDLMPGFGSETIADQTYTQNTAITTLTLPAAMGGDGTLTYSLSPALPTGLSFNATNRQLSGTPTAVAAMAEYTYKVADADNDEAMLTFDITVGADNMPTFGSETIADQTYTQNTAITTLTLPEATSGNGTLTYSLAPELPMGLSFNATNRQITGTSMVGASTTEHTYKATDADNDEDSLKFNLKVNYAVCVPDEASDKMLAGGFLMTFEDNTPLGQFEGVTSTVVDNPFFEDADGNPSCKVNSFKKNSGVQTFAGVAVNFDDGSGTNTFQQHDIANAPIFEMDLYAQAEGTLTVTFEHNPFPDTSPNIVITQDVTSANVNTWIHIKKDLTSDFNTNGTNVGAGENTYTNLVVQYNLGTAGADEQIYIDNIQLSAASN